MKQNKKKVVFIYNDRASICHTYMLVPEHTHPKFDVLDFLYPEDFEERIPTLDPNDIKLIFLGTYFPGDGRPNIKSGYFRGLNFYKESILKNPFYKDIPVIMTSTMTTSKANEIEVLRKELGQEQLRPGDAFHDIMDFGCRDLEKLLEKT